ncbi:hypothetical protein [Xanthobacter agilis]|uniref:Glycerophosphoryl diester phosphodiesterase membrane domain-containing protein n=1 Tax=Xanthobacter agilis TaxID=47492 RepID=A0ABU0L870_XANAG|nr:hypothetical protein [Xanthobacter agilis]MDQ0503347.1 hypothetical protein [Xanthobacter agilis]
MSEAGRLPVFETVKLTLRWSKTICLRHWRLLLVYAAIFIAGHFFILYVSKLFIELDLKYNVMSPLATNIITVSTFVLNIIISLLLLFSLAILTQHEIWRGPCRLDAQTLGRGPGRILGYAFDSLAIAFMALFGLLLGLGVVVAIFTLAFGGKPGLGGVLLFIAMPIVVLLTIAMTLRLSLRLPSRAIGQPVRWRDVWRMGRGNTWRLLAANLLIVGVSLLLSVASLTLIVLPTMTLPITMVQMVGLPGFGLAPSLLTIALSILIFFGLALISQIQAIIGYALLSVAYAQLKPLPEGPATGAAEA